MGLSRLLGVLSPVHISLVTLLSGAKLAGTDPAGNKYFSARPRRGYKRERRWVIYNGTPEASKVPPEWHGWLHHQTNVLPPPATAESFRQPWQKPHSPNMTGSDGAYRPPGHVLSGSHRAAATGDYEPWTPSE